MKKLLFILPEFKFGGTVFSTLNMIYFLRDKYDISVLAMTHQGPVKEKYVSAGINILPKSFLLDTIAGSITDSVNGWYYVKYIVFKLIKKTMQLLGLDYTNLVFKVMSKSYSNKYDVVLSCQEGISTHFMTYIKATKHIAWFRSECKHWLPEIDKDINVAVFRESKFYAECDNIVCVSQTTCDDMKSYFPNLASKIIAIHNIQDLEKIYADAKMGIDDSRFNVSNFKIVSIGRMSPQKRFAQIPEIARKVKELGCDFTWVVIVGGNTFSEYDNFIANINKYDVSDVVVCLGEKLNPYPYIANSDLLVNTSYVEACPRVINEAKILQIPIICTDFSSAAEFVNSGKYGYVSSIDEIHNYIANIIINQSLYDFIISESKAFKFSNVEILDKIINIIEN